MGRKRLTGAAVLLLAISIGGCYSGADAQAPSAKSATSQAALPAEFSETELLALGTRVWDRASKDGIDIQRVGANEELQVVWFSGPELTDESAGAAALRELVKAEGGDAVSVEIIPYVPRIEVVTG